MPCLSRRDLLTGSVAAIALPARAQTVESKTVFMVLWRGETNVERGFRAYFEESGWPLDITVRSLERDRGRLPEVIAEIREADPDLVYTFGTTITLGVAGRDPGMMESVDDYPPQITDRPIVFTMVSQPVRSRIVKNFGPSGRNVTGVSPIVPLKTQFDAMRAYMPVDRIATIYTPTEQNSVLATEQLADLGKHFNIRIDQYPVPLDSEGHPDPESLPDIISAAAETGPQFLYLGPDSFITQYARLVTGLANEHRLPSFAAIENVLTDSDALYGLVAPYRKIGELAAAKAESILFSGGDVSRIPVEILPEFSYLIRADVARELEIYPKLSLLDYAETLEP